MNKLPIISIITVCFNSEKTIHRTILSLINQDYTNIEYIIIDGKSSDKTVEIINSFKPILSSKMINFVFISEKDNGLYDAMNKGVKNSKGNLIGILNSDDVYKNDHVISDVVSSFNDTKADCLYGNLEFVDLRYPKKVVRYWNSGVGSFLNGWHPPHPATFFSKSLYNKYGLYNIHFEISSDYDLMYRFIHLGKSSMVYLNKTLVTMSIGGKSTSSIKSHFIANKEIFIILSKFNHHFKIRLIFLRLIFKLKQYYAYKGVKHE
jgi:glycosyltransferase involved in cell wall biosynthesis